jgi:hypothetical protein
MAVTMKRHLTNFEKGEILDRYGRVSFATGHGIPENQPVQFDQIRALVTGSN